MIEFYYTHMFILVFENQKMFKMIEYFGFPLNMLFGVKDSKNGSPEILKLVPNCPEMSSCFFFFKTT